MCDKGMVMYGLEEIKGRNVTPIDGSQVFMFVEVMIRDVGGN